MAGTVRHGGLLLAAVLLSGCAGAAGDGSPGSAPEADVVGSWELVVATSDGTPLVLPDEGGATLTIESARLGGTAFCNGYGSTYRLDGDALTLGGLANTEMACAPELMAAEHAFLDALGAVDTAAVANGDLLLRGQGVELRFRPLPPGPVRELVGTRWVLETLLHEDMASSTLGEPAVLVLAADGALSGSTGSRTLSGRWAQTDELLVFPQLSADGDCPADVRSQDEHVRAVLGGETTATVDGGLLTLTGGDGRGLVYRAE